MQKRRTPHGPHIKGSVHIKANFSRFHGDLRRSIGDEEGDSRPYLLNDHTKESLQKSLDLMVKLHQIYQNYGKNPRNTLKGLIVFNTLLNGPNYKDFCDKIEC